MIRRISDLQNAYPDSDNLRRGTRAPLVSAVFNDPETVGQAYDSAVELGYSNEEITAAATGALPPEPIPAPAGGGRGLGAVRLALQPHCEEEGQRIAERWRACGGRAVAGIR